MNAMADDALRRLMTMFVLYGIFPAMALGAGASMLRVNFMRGPLARLRVAFDESPVTRDLAAKGEFRFKDNTQARARARARCLAARCHVPSPEPCAA